MTIREIKRYRKQMEEGTSEMVDGQLIVKLPSKFLKLQSLLNDVYNKAEEAGEETFNRIYKDLTKHCKELIRSIEQ